MTELSLFPGTDLGDDPRFLQDQLITYIGNKRSLLPFIGRGLEIVQSRLGRDRLRMLDLFSGTGVVSRFFKRYADELIVNDLEAYSRITNACYLTNRSAVNIDELKDLLLDLKRMIGENLSPGFITEMYSPRDESNITADDRVFYTRRNAIMLDSARRAIDHLPADKQKYFLGPLLSEASIHANTSGVFKGFYKNAAGIGQFGGNAQDALTRIMGTVDLALPVLSRYESEVRVYQKDANSLVHEITEVDVAYLDPPYNQHPYGSNYFMLNLIVDYTRPSEVSRVSGIPTDWNRSRYNQRREAEAALFQVVRDCPAKFVLISYNSEGFVSQDRFLEALNQCGTLTVLESQYNTFRGSRNLRERSIHVTEFLYLLEKR